ncbi:hypothetical protein OAA60_00650 [Porticoccaceae bacterium]|nr:hypothetical protein [Porticoccaceae bacterium]
MDYTKGLGEFRSRAQSFDSIEEVMKPYESLIKSEGGTPETVVGQMLNSAYVLRQGTQEQKVTLAIQMAQEYGFINELGSSLVSGSLPAAPQQGLSPEQVEQIVNQRLEQERNQSATSSIESDIRSFQEAVAEDGTLKYPYFENVRGNMANILETDSRGLTLEEAYNEALWANPDTRELQLTKQLEVTQATDKAKKHRENAEKAAANNLDRSPAIASQQPDGPAGSIDDTLGDTLAAIKLRSA